MTAPPTPPLETLQSVFGFPAFREGQEAVVSRLLDGKSVLAVFPTGAGKSLCYQLPALLLDGVTLVISPLIALMKDQIDFLVEKGVRAARLDSSVGLEELRRTYRELREGSLKLLYIAPERLANERFLQTLRRLNLSMLAVDEAHCISEWGHNFRPDYMKIAALASDLGVARVLALTATATPSVAKDIATAFAISAEDVVQTGFYRPNLSLHVTPVGGRSNGVSAYGGIGVGEAAPATRTPTPPHTDTPIPANSRNQLLLDRLRSRPRGPTIVYVTLQKTAEDVASALAAAGLPARPYHAGMDAELRHEVQDWFMASSDAIVVATIAFGMGIDKSDIRYVYHYNLPKSLENYAQEVGRAGRDGKESTCELLASADDVTVLENFTYGDTPTPQAVAALLDHLLAGSKRDARTFDVSTYELSGEFDVRPLVIETLLTYLELDGLIESTGPFYTEYKFVPQRPSAEMIGRFDARRQAFLKKILSRARKLTKWFVLNVDEAAAAAGEPREKVIAALNYLEEQGDLTLQVAGARHGYRYARTDFDPVTLTRTLTARFMDRERRDIERLKKVLEFADHPGCHTNHLLDYFGEKREQACGHCGWCRGERPGRMPPAQRRPLGDREAALLRDLRAENHPALATPRQLARFLCGINSPSASRSKLGKHQLFGAFGTVPFQEIMRFVDR